jgi:hypothetical protein
MDETGLEPATLSMSTMKLVTLNPYSVIFLDLSVYFWGVAWGETFISAPSYYRRSVIDYRLKIVCAKVTIVADAINPNAKLTSDWLAFW